MTVKPRADIRESGPLSREYAQRFKKHHNQLTIPKKPIKMQWFEEDELAKAIYEIMMTETDLELMKRQLALESDFNVEDCWRMFDLNNSGWVTRRQFEEVFNLMQLYPTALEIELTLFRYDADHNGRLSKKEFTDIILPNDQNYRELVERRKPYCSEMSHARLQFFLQSTTDKLKRML